MAATPEGDAAGTARQPRPATSNRAAAHETRADGGRSLFAVLLALTLFSGLVDAVCYLGLGRVFTANMTGNVVVLGFAAAGAPGFSVTASLTSLGVFLVGAIAGGRLATYGASRSRILVLAVAVEVGFVAVAAGVAFAAATVATGRGRHTTIALLAFAMASGTPSSGCCRYRT